MLQARCYWMVLLVLVVDAVDFNGSCHPGWDLINRRCYKLARSELATWFEADKLCQASGARLLFLDSPSDDAIIKNLRAKVTDDGVLIWARHNPANRNTAVPADMLDDSTCFGLDVAPGRPAGSALGPCLEYRPYICETAPDQAPVGRESWTETEGRTFDDSHHLQPAVNILKLSGGILAGLIVGLLFWIAIGIAVVVYLRRRRRTGREIQRILDEHNLTDPTKDEQGELTLEPLQATEVLVERSDDEDGRRTKK